MALRWRGKEEHAVSVDECYVSIMYVHVAKQSGYENVTEHRLFGGYTQIARDFPVSSVICRLVGAPGGKRYKEHETFLFTLFYVG